MWCGVVLRLIQCIRCAGDYHLYSLLALVTVSCRRLSVVFAIAAVVGFPAGPPLLVLLCFGKKNCAGCPCGPLVIRDRGKKRKLGPSNTDAPGCLKGLSWPLRKRNNSWSHRRRQRRQLGRFGALPGSFRAARLAAAQCCGAGLLEGAAAQNGAEGPWDWKKNDNKTTTNILGRFHHTIFLNQFKGTAWLNHLASKVSILAKTQKASWWQLKYFFMFIPKLGEIDAIWLIFVQMGWFNHQLGPLFLGGFHHFFYKQFSIHVFFGVEGEVVDIGCNFQVVKVRWVWCAWCVFLGIPSWFANKFFATFWQPITKMRKIKRISTLRYLFRSINQQKPLIGVRHHLDPWLFLGY